MDVTYIFAGYFPTLLLLVKLLRELIIWETNNDITLDGSE